MHPAVGPALVTFSASLAMAGYVTARRYKEHFHWMLSGFLAGMLIWTGGVLTRFTIASEAQLGTSVKVIMIGILVTTSFWLLTAVAYDRSRSAAARARWTVVVLAVGTLFMMALFTNEGHRLFIRKLDFASLAAGPRAFVGPVFWAFLAWAYGCVAAGIVHYLRAARWMLRAESRQRAWVLALAAAFPAAASTVYVFQLVPVEFDLTPSGLVISMILLTMAVFRYRLFESVPLAREAVVSHLEDGVVMASAGGRITAWNPAAVGILGEESLCVGAPLEDAILSLLDAESPEVGRAAAAIRSDAGRPAAIRSTNGRVIEVTTANVDEGRGAVAGQFAILSDRSEADRAEQLARQTQRFEIVAVLAAGVAHEINDPLTFVRANLVEIERLGRRVEAEGKGPDAELAAELEDLRDVALETLEGVDRMRRIVEGMRELSVRELEGGPETVDLVCIARDALRLAHLEGDGDGTDAPAPAVELTLSPVPPARGNADRLVQVVLNLLVNARQALVGVANPRIRLSCEVRDGAIELLVRDNGAGVPAALRHRVFDPFFTTRGPDEGTGLGLAIALDIAREHDGILEERPQPGGGACFALRIPMLDPPLH